MRCYNNNNVTYTFTDHFSTTPLTYVTAHTFKFEMGPTHMCKKGDRGAAGN